MLVYRIAHIKYKEDTLTGIGAEKFGGRWNEQGTRAVYCSENRALALLEYYVHSDNVALLPKELLLAVVEIPDDLPIVELNKLPEGWNRYPYRTSSTRVFSNFVRQGNFFALRVPSTIVPMEDNLILNPLFSDFSRVKVRDFVRVQLDARLKAK